MCFFIVYEGICVVSANNTSSIHLEKARFDKVMHFGVERLLFCRPLGRDASERSDTNHILMEVCNEIFDLWSRCYW